MAYKVQRRGGIVMKKATQKETIQMIKAAMPEHEIHSLIDLIQRASVEECITACSFLRDLEITESEPPLGYGSHHPKG